MKTTSCKCVYELNDGYQSVRNVVSIIHNIQFAKNNYGKIFLSAFASCVLASGCTFYDAASRKKLHVNYLSVDASLLLSVSSEYNCTDIDVFYVSAIYNEKWEVEVAGNGWYIRKHYSSPSSFFAYNGYVSGGTSTGSMSFSWSYSDYKMGGQTITGNIGFVFMYTDQNGDTLKRKLSISITNANLASDTYAGQMLSDSGLTMTAEFDSTNGNSWDKLPGDAKLDLKLLADSTDAISINGDTPAGVTVTKAKVGETGDGTDDEDGGLSGGAIAGIVIAVIVVTALVVVGVFFFIKKRNSDKIINGEEGEEVKESKEGKEGEEAADPFVIKDEEQGGKHRHKHRHRKHKDEEEKKRKHKHKHKHKHRNQEEEKHKPKHCDKKQSKPAPNRERHRRSVSSSESDYYSSLTSYSDSL